MRWFNPLACLSFLALMVVVGCAPKPEETVYRGISLRPPGAVEVEGAVPANAIYMFDQRDYKGKTTRIENVTAQPPGATERVGGRSDSMTSLKWDLPPGIAVVFYENADATGDTFTIWGRGQIPSVSLWAFNDKVSRWAWYSVGTGSAASASVEAGRIPPHGAKKSASNLPSDTIELYADRDLKGTLTSISPVTRQPQDYEDVKAANDRMTSLRWNLPEGIVVVLYDNIDGTGRQFSIWGQGEIETVSPWNFNDRVSSYAWYRIGEAPPRGTISAAVTVNK